LVICKIEKNRKLAPKPKGTIEHRINISEIKETRARKKHRENRERGVESENRGMEH